MNPQALILGGGGGVTLNEVKKLMDNKPFLELLNLGSGKKGQRTGLFEKVNSDDT